MSKIREGRGQYLGTEINGKWWRRYSKDGLLARGNGDYWMDATAIYFLRYLTDAPIGICFRDVIDVKTGRWHSGRWVYGIPVIKILWTKAGTRLSSGFVFSRDIKETESLLEQIRSLVEESDVRRVRNPDLDDPTEGRA